MLFRNLLCALFACFLFLGTQAQSNYNKRSNFLNANKVWAFPINAGIDFNIGNGIGIQTAMNDGQPGAGSNEGAAAVSDPLTGKLLFYSNGRSCWNAQHQLMPNGTQLGGDDYVTIVQGAVIVPFINDPNKYYLFSLNGDNINVTDSIKGTRFGSLFYSVVDRTLDNGKGAVLPGFKNITLDTAPLSESMIAIPGNNCDVWLIVHEPYAPKYKAYHISATGVDPTPIVSTTAGVLTSWYSPGSLAVSPNRAFIAMNSTFFGGLTLAKFDATTGIVSNELQIGAYSNIIGSSVAFSPDNSKLYAFCTPLVFPYFVGIYQYDISNFDTASINASQYPVVSGLSELTYLRLYNDTIYCAIRKEKYIHRINNPNLSGTNCGYQPNAIALFSGTFSSGTLPVETVYSLRDTLSLLALDTLICSGYENGITLRPALINNKYTYTWNNAHSDTLRKVFDAGTYWVEYGDGCHTFIDSFILRASGLEKPVITIEVHKLSTQMPYTTYQWLLDGHVIAGATQRIYNVTENGNYQVVVTNETGCTDTSDRYEITNANGINDSKPLAHEIRLYPNPVQHVVSIDSRVPVSVAIKTIDGRRIFEVKNTNQINMSHLSEGVYLFYIYDSENFLLKVEKIVKKN